MTADPFRVIVVGGGPVGLTAAHVLAKAGIDYVILERRDDILADAGASLVLGVPTQRVFFQLGLLAKLNAIGVQIASVHTVSMDGKRYNNGTPLFALLKKSLGTSLSIHHRAYLVRLLYDSIDEAHKTRIHTGKNVTDIDVTDDGVSVSCEDGTTFHGSIVLGADGVHSRVAQCMRTLALEEADKDKSKSKDAAANVNDETPYLIEYRTLWCTMPRPEGYAPGDAADSRGPDRSTMFLCGADRAWIFLYEKLPPSEQQHPASKGDANNNNNNNNNNNSSSSRHRRHHYTEADVQAFADRFADVPISDKLRVKDVYPTRYTAGMADLEEGVLPHWSWRRIVLAGDACHKYTPNHGQGYNNGVQDIVVLANELHAALEGNKKGDTPLDQDTIADVFARYQEYRREVATADLKESAMVTRFQAWPNLLYRLFDRYILPHLPFVNRYLLVKSCKKLATRRVLDFVPRPEKEPIQGTIPWVHPIKKE